MKMEVYVKEMEITSWNNRKRKVEAKSVRKKIRIKLRAAKRITLEMKLSVANSFFLWAYSIIIRKQRKTVEDTLELQKWQNIKY